MIWNTKDSATQNLRNYAQTEVSLLKELPFDSIRQLIQLIHNSRVLKKNIYILGNGGSASTASHFACDLNKQARRKGLPHLRAISLTDNVSFLTALGNDEDYTEVFSQQLINFVDTGDMLIGISTSGCSANVVSAVRVAKSCQATTVALTGYDGGIIGQEAGLHINVPFYEAEVVEDIHLMISHMVSLGLRNL